MIWYSPELNYLFYISIKHYGIEDSKVITGLEVRSEDDLTDDILKSYCWYYIGEI